MAKHCLNNIEIQLVLRIGFLGTTLVTFLKAIWLQTIMARRKGRKRKASDESDEDTGPVNRVLGRKKKGLMLDSGSEEVQHSEEEKESKMKSRLKVEGAKSDPGSGRKGKILRCADSSEDENEVTGATPKAERMRKLEEMRNRVSAKKAKKKVKYSSSSSEASDDEGPGDEADEEDLPMWENEEAPPENVKVFVEDPEEKENSDLEGFVVSDGNEEADAKAGRLPDSEEEVTKKAAKSTREKRSSGKRRGNVGDLKLSDSEEDESIEASSSKAASRRTRSSVKKKGNSKQRKRAVKDKVLIGGSDDRSSSSEETE